ncbi:hypothetical protein ACTQ1R_09515 [Prevotellaceae bacterium LCP21S3_C11]|nr:hypothetical protein [Segatella hominis]MCF2591033.1 hypothetical protein [Segatella hominis]
MSYDGSNYAWTKVITTTAAGSVNIPSAGSYTVTVKVGEYRLRLISTR